MRSRRILISISIVVALALLLLFLATRLGPTVHTIDRSGEDAGSSATHTPTLTEAATEKPVERTNVAAATQLPRLPGFAEVRGVRLVVVDADSRDAVPGAVVHVFDDESGRFGPTNNYEHSMGPDVMAFIAAHGSKLVADADGAVDLPVVHDHRFVTARKADKSGLLELDASMNGLCEIEIRRSHDLEVHVRDTEDKPVSGVRVGLYPWSDSDSLADGVTDERGSCRFADFGLFTRLSDFEPEQMIVVRLALPFEPFVEQWIDPANIPEKPIELVMPPSGSLSITMVDEDHHVVRVPGTIFLFSTDATVHTRFEPSRATSEFRIPFENGVARIDGIGLDQELGMNVGFRGEGESGADVHGPKKAGEVISVEVEFLNRFTMLDGRIVDGSHKPLASTLFEWRRTTDDGRNLKRGDLNVFKTDEEGRFVWTMLRTPQNDAGFFTHRDAYLCEVSSAKDRRQARLKFPIEFTDEVTDLGDIVVSTGPPFVSGRVVDAKGRAIAGATVCVYAAASARGDAGSVCPPCTTDDDGTFAVFGPCLDLPLAVSVQKGKTGTPHIVPLVCAGEPLTIVLGESATATLMGTALVDRRALVDELQVMFVADDNDRSGSFTAYTWRAGDRVCFEIPDLPLTTGHVELHCAAATPPLDAVVEGISLAMPGESRLAQLADIDLRGKLPLAPDDKAPAFGGIEIVSPSGQPVSHGLIWVWNAAGEDATQHTWTNGRTSIAETDAFRVEIWAAGFREKVLQPVPRSARVVLEPEIELELRFDVPRELRDASVTLRGELWYAVQADTDFVPSVMNGNATFVVDGDGRAIVRLPSAGTFRANLSLSRVGVAGMDDIENEEIAVLPNPLVVRDVALRQSIDCKLDESGVRQALEDLGITNK